MPWLNNSHFSRMHSSTISGMWSHIAAFNETLARNPKRSSASITRHTPARLP